MQRIYFDHAATTPLDNQTLEKMLPYYTEFFGNADSPHFFGRKAQNALDEARDTVALLLNAKPNEIYFTSGGTESDNWAFLGGARAMSSAGRKKVVLSKIEHHAVLSAAETLEKDGFEVVYLPVDRDGKVVVEKAEQLIDENTAIVACMAANNETGVVQPYQEIVRLAKGKGALSFVDGVQLAPYQRLDVKEIGADLISLSAHKFYGPKGVGALYIKSGVKIEKLVVGGEQERGLRGGTTNLPAIVGLAHAYRKCVENMSANNEKIISVKQRFLTEIQKIDGVEINGSSSTGVVNLRFIGADNGTLLYNLDLQGVAVAAGSACASASLKPSHVLTAMGLDEKQAKECLRFSFGKDNTEEEVVKGVEILSAALEKIRSKK